MVVKAAYRDIKCTEQDTINMEVQQQHQYLQWYCPTCSSDVCVEKDMKKEVMPWQFVLLIKTTGNIVIIKSDFIKKLSSIGRHF